MIKGGFQGLDISGVDLTAQSPTLPGGYAACAAADGKPIRVLTAAGAVQCSVKKVSTNYVLAGITGDGKILSITIGSTDGIAVSETEIPSAVELEEYLGPAVNIISATSADPYVATYDGILCVSHNSEEALTASPSVFAKTGASHNEGVIILRLDKSAPNHGMVSCFVKKGSFLYCTLGGTSGVSINFYPYKPIQS